jgi:hypothetical protein
MSYYMRYISTDEQEITVPMLERILKSLDPQYSIANAQESPTESGDLVYGNENYGQIEINRPGDSLFEEELEELRGFLNEARGKKKEIVLQTLDNATTTVAIQVLWQERNTEQTLSKIDPLWQWLFSNRKGLLQVDGEGYYDSSVLILEEQ